MGQQSSGCCFCGIWIACGHLLSAPGLRRDHHRLSPFAWQHVNAGGPGPCAPSSKDHRGVPAWPRPRNRAARLASGQRTSSGAEGKRKRGGTLPRTAAPCFVPGRGVHPGDMNTASIPRPGRYPAAMVVWFGRLRGPASAEKECRRDGGAPLAHGSQYCTTPCRCWPMPRAIVAGRRVPPAAWTAPACWRPCIMIGCPLRAVPALA